MTAYSFQRRFVEPIRAETKGGTIRARRRSRNPVRPGGHALPGETLQLYTGMRTKLCELICCSLCKEVEPVQLHFQRNWIALGTGAEFRIIDSVPSLDEFARFDGFSGWSEMSLYWDPIPVFRGWHIRWIPLPRLRHEQTRRAAS